MAGQQARQLDAESGRPICCGLDDLKEIYLWYRGRDNICRGSVCLPKQHTLFNRPRTLVCHDMKNGYNEDRFVQGYNNNQAFTFYHWNCIDIFVYFSHHLVTIPPSGWINCAHRHNVLVLGTFITEWEAGQLICSEFLCNQPLRRLLVSKLVNMALYYRFDGWLLNIENSIQKQNITILAQFIAELTTALHQKIPYGKVIWYDSVINNGELKWQNELNTYNRIFFDSCDGIFLNYVWKPGNLLRSALFAGRDRQYDVYVGVDVFGRGCYKGGGFKTIDALELIREHDLSAAIFAPGWVYECLGEADFMENQNKFWNLLSSQCDYSSALGYLPITSSFCRGNGEKFYINGRVASDCPWNNLSAQQLQPSYSNAHRMYFVGPVGSIKISNISHNDSIAYNGGESLKIKGSWNPTKHFTAAVLRLFRTDVTTEEDLLVSYTYKLSEDLEHSVDVVLQLVTDSAMTYIILGHETKTVSEPQEVENSMENYGLPCSPRCNPSKFHGEFDTSNYLAFSTIEDSSAAIIDTTYTGVKDVHTGWTTRHYIITESQCTLCTICEVQLMIIPTMKDNRNKDQDCEFCAHLGEIKLLRPTAISDDMGHVTNLTYTDMSWDINEDQILLNVTLMWDFLIEDDVTDASQPEFFDVFLNNGTSSDVKFIGRSFLNVFLVCKHPIQILNDDSNHKISCVVQHVTKAGFRVNIKNAASITIPFE